MAGHQRATVLAETTLQACVVGWDWALTWGLKMGRPMGRVWGQLLTSAPAHQTNHLLHAPCVSRVTTYRAGTGLHATSPALNTTASCDPNRPCTMIYVLLPHLAHNVHAGSPERGDSSCVREDNADILASSSVVVRTCIGSSNSSQNAVSGNGTCTPGNFLIPPPPGVAVINDQAVVHCCANGADGRASLGECQSDAREVPVAYSWSEASSFLSIRSSISIKLIT